MSNQYTCVDLILTKDQRNEVAEWYNLGIWLAIQANKRHPACDSAELRSAAGQAVCRACKKFDAARQVPFRYFLVYVVKNALKRVIVNHYARMNHPLTPVSFTALPEDGYDPSFSKDPDIEMVLDYPVILALLKSVLTPRYYDCYVSKHRDGMTLDQIGKRHHVGRERARQLIRDAEGVLAKHQYKFAKYAYMY